MKIRTNYSNETIDMLNEDTFKMVFKYTSSALINGLANGTIINEENYKSKIPKSVKGEWQNVKLW